MLKAVLEKPFKLKLLELDIPVPKKKEVLIKVLVAGICGSDLHAYRGTQPFLSYPRVLGHEIAGEIAEVGEGIKELRRGDLVTVDPVFSCGKCYACTVERGNCCRDVQVMGVHMDGASVVIEATGVPQAVKDSLKIVSPAGRVVILGMTNDSVRISPIDLIRKELDFRGSRLNNKLFPYILALLPSIKNKARRLITHRFSIKDINAAFKLLDEHLEKTIKVLLFFTKTH